jgi:hypothetical protein
MGAEDLRILGEINLVEPTVDINNRHRYRSRVLHTSRRALFGVAFMQPPIFCRQLSSERSGCRSDLRGGYDRTTAMGFTGCFRYRASLAGWHRRTGEGSYEAKGGNNGSATCGHRRRHRQGCVSISG